MNYKDLIKLEEDNARKRIEKKMEIFVNGMDSKIEAIEKKLKKENGDFKECK